MAEQTIALAAAWFANNLSNRFVQWAPPGSQRPEIDADLKDTQLTRVFGALSFTYSTHVTVPGNASLRIASSQAEDPLASGDDLSAMFESGGTVTVEIGSLSLTVLVSELGDEEPYSGQPTNSADVGAFADAVAALSTVPNGTLTLRDFVPAAPAFADDTGTPFTGTVGTAITDITVPEATGTPAPTYAVVGSLPAGLQFDTGTRVISGTPEAGAAGSGTITIRATNSQGSDDWTVQYTFSVPHYPVDAEAANWLFNVPAATGLGDAAPEFADDTGDAISGNVGTAIADVVVPEADGHPAPTYAAVGSLPTGVTFTPGTRTLSFDESAIEVGSGTIRIRATNSFGSDDWTVDYTFAAAPLVTSQVLNLPASFFSLRSNAIRWNLSFNNRIAIDEAFWPGAEARFLASVYLYDDGRVELRFASSQTEGSGTAGDELISTWEDSGSFTLEAGGQTITVAGPGDSDTTEPYVWTPSNSAEVIAVENVLDGNANGTLAGTLTLRYETPAVAPSFTDDTGDAFTGTLGTAIADITVPEADGTPAPTYAVVGSLPNGLSFDTTTRVISGTPQHGAGGAGTIRIRATNSAGSDDWTVAYTFAVPAFSRDADPANWLFNVPDATGETTPPAFTGDAEAANWEFDVPDASAQHTPPGTDGDAEAANWSFDVPMAEGATAPPAFDGDAAAAAFAFQVPDATGETVPPNLAGNAEAANWLFNIPDATGIAISPGTADNGDAQPASWAFQVPQATGATVAPAFDGDAAAASWAFQVPDASAQHTPPGTDGDAEAVNLLFNVPDATGQTTPPDNAGVAQPANWAFDVPDATGSTVSPAFDGDAEGASWAFAVPPATGSSSLIADNGDADAVAWAFNIPAAEGSTVSPALPASAPLFPRLEGGDGMGLTLYWRPPLDDGGGTIARYEAMLCDETGGNCGWEDVGLDGERGHRFRGLRAGGRYTVTMRAVNEAGAGAESEEAEGAPYVMPPTIVPPPGAAIPLIDADRQSLIVRLDNRDCRITVWWQPSDESWYGQLEVPTNTVAVTGRRLALNAGLLDRLAGDDILPGNIVVREIGETGLDPDRRAWASGNYELRWEPSNA